MSYPVQAPAAPAAPASRRPVVVDIAVAVLVVMAVAGLAYAIATVTVAPGTVDRFRDAAGGASATNVDGFATVVWIGAAIALILAVVLVALYVVLALAVRRGSNGARIAVWVISALGLIAGCASTITALTGRSGDPTPGTVGAALTDAYPHSWTDWNLALAVAQMVGYVLVAVLLALSPGEFFGRRARAKPDPYAAGTGQPGYGQPGHGPADYGPADYGQPDHGLAGHGAVGYGRSGYGVPRPLPHEPADNPWAAPADHLPGARPADAPAPLAGTQPPPPDDPDGGSWSRPAPGT